MLGSRGERSSKGQIALEFLVVYAFISIVFAIVFTLIVAQRAATLAQQEYGLLQLQAQNIATYLDQAVQAGNGYSVTIPITGAINANPYNISISSSGVVLLQTKVIKQIISAYAFSYAKSLVINGTQIASGNGVSVYLIPSYTGGIRLSNAKGTVYVDQPSPSGVALAQTINVNQNGNVKAAAVTQGAYLTVPITSALEPSKFTISVWYLETGYPSGYPYAGTVYGSGGYAQGYELLLPQSSDTHGGIVVGNGAEAYISDPSSPPLGTWNNYVATFDGATAKLYLNGKLVNSGAQAGVTFAGGINQFVVGSVYNQIDNPAIYYSNVQLYNTALTSNQVNSIYYGGIALAPVMPANVVGWWPLNGNSNDYSGNGYAATGPLSYNGVAQVTVHVTAGNGNALITSPVGFVSGRGIVSGAASGLATYTDANGNATAFLTANSFATGATNLTITAFNGNSTIAGNLVGWWPLNEGSGNLTYDLSTHGNVGTFNSPGWSTLAQNVSNFAAGSFPGALGSIAGNNKYGFITVGQTSSLLNLARNDSFTVMLWVYSYGASATHDLGMIGDWPAGGQGFDLTTYTSSTANAVLDLVVNGIGSPQGASLTANHWQMLTAEYNGSTGQTAIFENATQVMSNVVTKGLDLGQATTPVYIGDNPWQTAGGDDFNGLITNVQLYSGYLTPAQVRQLYRNGINSAPVGDSGLVSWWPLNGETNVVSNSVTPTYNNIISDYSANNNTGLISYNVIFANAQFTSSANTTFAAASFNGQSSYVNTLTTGFPTGSAGRSVFAWVYWTGSVGTYYMIQTYGTQTSDEAANFYIASTGNLAFDGYGNHLFSSFYPTQGSWHFVGYTYSAAATKMTIYMDGQNYTGPLQSGALNTVISGGDPSNIGAESNLGAGNGGLLPWKGYISDVQVYNTPLTQAQVRQLYQQGLPLSRRMNITLG